MKVSKNTVEDATGAQMSRSVQNEATDNWGPVHCGGNQREDLIELGE